MTKAEKEAKLKELGAFEKKLYKAERAAYYNLETVRTEANKATERVRKHHDAFVPHSDKDGLPVLPLPLTNDAIRENTRLRKIAALVIKERQKAETLWINLNTSWEMIKESRFWGHVPAKSKIATAEKRLAAWQTREK